jgi:hypothetical protein
MAFQPAFADCLTISAITLEMIPLIIGIFLPHPFKDA